MSLMRRTKKSKTAPAVERVSPELTPLEVRNEVFTLASVGGDSNLKHAASRLREMSSNERRALRESIQRLDATLDDVCLELMSRRSRTDE